MKADNVTLHQQDNIVVAEGNVTFSDGELKTISDKAVNHLNTEQVTLENTNYKFLCGLVAVKLSMYPKQAKLSMR